MTECPFCHKESENVVQRVQKLPGLNLAAKSQQPMCYSCFKTLEDKLKEQDG